MPKAYPEEFRREVMAVARNGQAPLTRIAKDFGISESCLANWLKRADIEDGNRPGVPRAESEELRELRKRNKLLEQENGVLRRAAAFFARELPPKNEVPLVRDLAADRIPVAVACRVLGISKQAFYTWCEEPMSQRDWDDAHLINAALEVHADDPEFGYWFIADELADLGFTVGENRVQRLCSLQGIYSAFAKKRGLTRRPGPGGPRRPGLSGFHRRRP